MPTRGLCVEGNIPTEAVKEIVGHTDEISGSALGEKGNQVVTNFLLDRGILGLYPTNL